MREEITIQNSECSPLDDPSILGLPKLSLLHLVRLYGCRLPAVLRSALGHLRLRFPKDLSCGPSLELETGAERRFVPNRRTLARFEGIQRLSATLPWVDKTEWNIFLMGFDVGERHALSNLGKTEHDDSEARLSVSP